MDWKYSIKWDRLTTYFKRMDEKDRLDLSNRQLLEFDSEDNCKGRNVTYIAVSRGLRCGC
jgi:hypothetical protein